MYAVGRGAGRVVLRRGFFARLRVGGAGEFVSLLGIVTIGLILNDARNGRAPVSDGWAGDLFVVAVLGMSVAVRVAVATESVSADRQGVRWRSLFRTSVLPWDRIESMSFGRMYLFPSRTGPDQVIQIRTTDGRIRKLRASAWCERASREWLAEVAVLRW